MAMAEDPGDRTLSDATGGSDSRDPAEAAGDHAMGLELQLVEVVEQVRRAAVQERWDDLRELRAEESRLEAELARSAEAAVRLSE